VDNFARKFMSEYNADHIITALKQHYTIMVDKEATKYIVLPSNGTINTAKFMHTCQDI
jgi:hypothetical protein